MGESAGDYGGRQLHAHIEIRDTLQMIIHRVPKKFLFFRYGTKLCAWRW